MAPIFLLNAIVLFVGFALGRSSDLDYNQQIYIRGSEQSGYSGDGGLAYNAKMSRPEELVADKYGNLYIADEGNNVIRFVNKTTGIISTVAGNGTAGYNGDNAPISEALLHSPNSITIDKDGNIVFADAGNYLIRKMDFSRNEIVNLVGTGSRYDSFGPPQNGVVANEYPLPAPTKVRIDSHSNIFIVVNGGDSIRFVNSSTGLISTYAGRYGQPGYKTNCLAKDAWLSGVQGIWFDKNDNLYIAESWDGVRKFDSVTTYNSRILEGDSTNRAECDECCYNGPNGDGGSFEKACMCNPYSGWADAENWYVLEYDGERIRKINWETGIIHTIAGYNLPKAESSSLTGDATKSDIGFVTFMTGTDANELFSLALWENQVRLYRPVV